MIDSMIKVYYRLVKLHEQGDPNGRPITEIPLAYVDVVQAKLDEDKAKAEAVMVAAVASEVAE